MVDKQLQHRLRSASPEPTVASQPFLLPRREGLGWGGVLAQAHAHLRGEFEGPLRDADHVVCRIPRKCEVGRDYETADVLALVQEEALDVILVQRGVIDVEEGPREQERAKGGRGDAESVQEEPEPVR